MNTSRSPHPFHALAAVAVLAGIFAVAGCGEGGNNSQPSSVPSVPGGNPTPNPNLLVPPVGSVYLGIYVNPTQTASPPPSLLSGFEQALGRTMAIAPHYYSFYDDFPGAYEQDDLAHGRISVDSWNCQPPNAAVAAGKDDAAIRARADAIKAWGHKIFLRYMWEMNLPASPAFREICYDPATDLPNGVFSPQEFVAAWDRIRAIFNQEGVTNVIWLWNPSGTVNPLPYYPGDAETDWVGFDKYDIVSSSVSQLYAQPYTWLKPLNKPILLSETGANSGFQQTFFQEMGPTLSTQFPQIKAMMYFDSQKGTVNSWVVATPPPMTPQFSAFQIMATSPYFSATPPPGF